MIVALVVVFALGALTGFAELIGRYRDEPIRAVAARPGLVYMLINALAAVAAFAVIRAFDWRFGLAADASDAAVSTLQVLVAGLAAAALFRTSLFTARIGDQDVSVGPSAVLDVLLRTVDRAVDRRRGIARLAVVAALPKGLSFERDAVTLTSYATASLQNLSLAEAERLGNRGNELRLTEELTDAVKMRMFAFDLMGLVGEEGLRAAIAQLTQQAPSEPPVAEDDPVPVVEVDEPPAEEDELRRAARARATPGARRAADGVGGGTQATGQHAARRRQAVARPCRGAVGARARSGPAGHGAAGEAIWLGLP